MQIRAHNKIWYRKNSRLKNTKAQGSVSDSDPLLENQIKRQSVLCFIDTKKTQTPNHKVAISESADHYWDVIGHCEDRFQSPCLPQNYWVVLGGEENNTIRDKDRLRSDPHEFPGFLR